MASTTRLRDRIFAAFGAVLFLVSACAVTAYYIVTSRSSDTPASQTAAACDITTPVDAATEPTPEVYKPTEPVASLQTTDLTPGTGTTVKTGDCLVMKYYGTLANDGAVFDQNFSDPKALQFNLGENQVIPGWDQGLVGMKVGGTRRLVIPSSLGYGPTGQGKIPANADLVFVVKLDKIKK